MSAPASDPFARWDPELRLWSLQTMIVTDTVLCSLSLIGAAAMISSFLFIPSMRKTRHRLIFGLATADFGIAMTVFATGVHDLVSSRVQSTSAGCQASGFLYLTFALASVMWNLAIAVATYMLLVYPLASASRLLSTTRFYIILSTAIWGTSLAIPTAGITTYQVVEVGGMCFFRSRTADHFGDLVLFIPRCLCLGIVVVLYTRLFFFYRNKSSPMLRRPSNPVAKVYNKVRNTSKDSSYTLWSVSDPNQLMNAEWPPTNAGDSEKSFGASPLCIQTYPEHSKPAQDGINWNTQVYWTGHAITPSLEIIEPTSVPPVSPRAVTFPADIRDSGSSESIASRSSTPIHSSRRPSANTLLHPSPLADSILVSPPAPSTPSAFPSLDQPLPSLEDDRIPLSASDMNRKASLLMLWYPAAYSVVWIVSLARIIINLSDSSGDKATFALHGLSRWFILASGLVDFFIFLVVERAFSRAARGSRKNSRSNRGSLSS